MGEAVPGPSHSGSVVLDLGPHCGALVLHAPPELDGREVEISPCGQPGDRTHSQVRQRHVGSGVRYAAVYPALAPGDYLLWQDAATPAMTVTIAAGAVTAVRWPGG